MISYAAILASFLALDLNQDRVVDSQDISVVLSQWGDYPADTVQKILNRWEQRLVDNTIGDGRSYVVVSQTRSPFGADFQRFEVLGGGFVDQRRRQ